MTVLTLQEREKQLESGADELADRVEELGLLVPAGEPVGLLLDQARSALSGVANHVAAYGFQGQYLADLQSAAAGVYAAAGRATEKPEFKHLAAVIRGDEPLRKTPNREED
jgi:hypothetical protein